MAVRGACPLSAGIQRVMALAWYGHLAFKDKTLLLVILASWDIASVDYC